MYPEDGLASPFKKDSLEVFNEDGRKFNFVSFILEQDPRNPLNRYYAVRIAPAFIIPDDNDSFTKEKTKKIYLRYDYNNADTFTLVFKAYKDKCDKGQYEYLNICRRGSLVSTLGNSPGAVFTVNY